MNMVLLTRLTFIGKFYFGLGQLGDRQDNCLPSRFPQDDPLSNGFATCSSSMEGI